MTAAFGKPGKVYGPGADVDSKLTPRWYPLVPHPVQLQLINSKARFKICPAARRSGKTERAKRSLVLQALRESSQGKYLDYRYFAAAPTRDQAKTIWWSDLKALIPKRFLGGRIRESELVIPLITGAEICVVGLDRAERIEGRSWNGGVIDEIANTKPGIWEANIRPALADRNGWCWLIGTPEGRGEYYNMYQRAISGEDPEWEGFTWISADILPAKEIESARRSMSEELFQQEYEASWITFKGRAYHPFLATTHCAPLKYTRSAPLILTFDFNYQPGTAAVLQEMRLPSGVDGVGVIGEVYIPRHSSTPAVCRRIIQDWGEHPGPVYVYGDSTGGAGGSSRVQGSDWDLVKAELRPVFGSRLYIKVQTNPRERARVNAVNFLLKNAAGEIRLMVDPQKAPRVVKDFEGVRLLEGGSGEIDKKSDPMLSHLSDGIGYLCVQEWPVVPRQGAVLSSYQLGG
jgi:hypothetical protein